MRSKTRQVGMRVGMRVDMQVDMAVLSTYGGGGNLNMTVHKIRWTYDEQ
jgi:hypothetical protein